MAKRKPIIPRDEPPAVESTIATSAPSEVTSEPPPVELVPSHDATATPPLPAHPPASPPSDGVLPDAATPSETETPKGEYRAQGIKGDYIAGVRLLEDRRFKQMQLAFREKPSDAVRHAVREAGFQWRSAEQVWTLQIDPEQAWQTRSKAHATFEAASAMIRAEMGVGQEVG